MVLYGTSWYFMVLYDTWWHFMVLHDNGIWWYFVLRSVVGGWFCLDRTRNQWHLQRSAQTSSLVYQELVSVSSCSQTCLKNQRKRVYWPGDETISAIKSYVGKVFGYYNCVTVLTMKILWMQCWKRNWYLSTFYSSPSTEFFELA